MQMIHTGRIKLICAQKEKQEHIKKIAEELQPALLEHTTQIVH